MEELTTQLLVYLKGVWKYRWVSVAVAWIVAVVGWVIVYKLPDDYQASARIYVDTQNVLKPLLQGMTVSPDLQQQVSIMSRTLISRPNVERVIRMVDLDIKTKDSKDQDRLVKELMDKIKLGTTGRDNLFTIAYSNQNPKLAKDIVQSLLTLFVEGGLGNKTQDSSSAIRFIDEQIKSYEEKLITGENNLKAFKQKNIGMMPQQGNDYYSQLSRAIEDLNKTKLELREAQQARDAIKRQITGDEPVLLVDQGEEGAASSIVNVELDSRIQALSKNLDALRLNYTELHPDIIAAKRLIAQLEERKIEESKLTRNSSDPGRNYSPMLQQLNVALADAEADVASMNARVEEYTARYERLKSLSNAVPQVEAELAQLNRDYQVNKANYEKLLERRESAKISGDLGSTTDLVSFRVIDPPTVSDRPVGPDRGKFFSIVFLGSLLAGIGIAFVISQIRPTFHSQISLREISGKPILGSIPMIWTDTEKIKRRKRLYAFGLSLLSLLGLYGALMLKMA
ncbi:XrtA system polysaccharide chain length determinant [Nitrosospira multiformis]|uniref:Polysaccharide chain length determinant protein, PEP-CTERM locus subfamily n=1 Tax=Nitrosospira multiformis TaxID=1231 RepID=A0A1I7IN63_9PROT|nr:XrtA system polysaccharide chain length determinant [Nitrosospira multiformis]SFU74371.1 polysaccharide chain length determinant protein, PEP-CTERM locus subfamily [Nitrosospira multiformis]